MPEERSYAPAEGITPLSPITADHRGRPAPGAAASLRDRLRSALGPSYQLGLELGRGGMGVVIRATDLRLRREVAIKVLPPELAWRADLRTRLVREAQLAAGLSHPNIVPIYDVGETEELVWLIMAFVEGETVGDKVAREGPQPLSVVRRVLQNVAWALAYAHARGVLHRDIKPDNIMLEAATGRPVVTDFGIAKALTGDELHLTAPGQLIGTLAYMAPEQVLGEGPADGRADLYSLGLVGFYLLTGQHALQGQSMGSIVAEHTKGVVPDPRPLRPRIPERLVGALNTALAAKPSDRAATAEAFAEAIGRAGPDVPETPAVIQTFFRASRRTFTTVSLFGIGIGVVGFSAIPGVLTLLFLGAVTAGWLRRLETVTRAGFGWEAVRRGLYGERARYLDERTVRPNVRVSAPLTSLLWFITVAGSALLGALYLDERPYQPPVVEGLNQVVLIVSAFGGFFAARTLGFIAPPEEVGRRRSSASAFRVAAPLCAVVAVMLGVPFGKLAGGGGGFLAAAITFLWLRYGPRLSARPTAEWRLSPVIDALGSWLFARTSWTKGRLRFRRDETMGGRRHRIGPTLIRRHQMAIDRALAKLPAPERQQHLDVVALVHLLGDGLEQTRRTLRETEARRLQLEAGAISVHGPDAETVLHDELERALAEEDRLRIRMREEWEALRSLESALAVGDTKERQATIATAVQLAKRVTQST
ncbi:MAG: serine/threonine-protein kinase [Gemmatimonadales bacterium]|nr:serine/threonine-protein kinase [Gemmatimonadales bacterium]